MNPDQTIRWARANGTGGGFYYCDRTYELDLACGEEDVNESRDKKQFKLKLGAVSIACSHIAPRDYVHLHVETSVHQPSCTFVHMLALLVTYVQRTRRKRVDVIRLSLPILASVCMTFMSRRILCDSGQR